MAVLLLLATGAGNVVQLISARKQTLGLGRLRTEDARDVSAGRTKRRAEGLAAEGKKIPEITFTHLYPPKLTYLTFTHHKCTHLTSTHLQ